MKINPTYSEETSVVLRYGQNISDVPYRFLQAASIEEGVRIVSLGNFYGVGISLLDMSSLSHTGTFKDWLAAVTVADCLAKGIERYVYQSSGNTGMALAAYSAKHHMRSLFFYPASSGYKLNPDFIDERFVTTIECALPEPLIKDITRKISEELNIPQIPTLGHQIETNKLRAYFLAEYCKHTGDRFDWHVQSLSSGYGPFGFYEGMTELHSELKPPKFLGIQQEAVHPFVDDYREQTGLAPLSIGDAPIIEPTLFRTKPTSDLVQRMRYIIRDYGGAVDVVSNARYESAANEAMDALQKAGVPLAVRTTAEREDVIEKAGLLALVGTLEAIRAHTIKEGERVLVAFTGGARQRTMSEFRPRMTISDIEAGTIDKIKGLIA